MDQLRPFRQLLRRWPLWLGLLWTVAFLWKALRRWSREHISQWMDPPYVNPEDADHYRRLFDWHTPLALAALPLLLLLVWFIGKRFIQRGA